MCGHPASETYKLAKNDKRETIQNIKEMPWLVSLGGFQTCTNPSWDHQCSGSLVTDRHVLTAAHCVESFKTRASTYHGGLLMRFGASNLTDLSNLITRKVQEYHTHPNYTYPQAYYDVGVLVAEKPIIWNQYIMPICLPMRPVDDEDYLKGDYVNLVGFGRKYNKVKEKYELSSNMDLASLQVMPRQWCQNEFNYNNEKYAPRDQSEIRLGMQRQLPEGNVSICCNLE